nr:hypothetical protein [Tanacetum cinerariifolium]
TAQDPHRCRSSEFASLVGLVREQFHRVANVVRHVDGKGGGFPDEHERLECSANLVR